jgi:hypothetical protein
MVDKQTSKQRERRKERKREIILFPPLQLSFPLERKEEERDGS